MKIYRLIDPDTHGSTEYTEKELRQRLKAAIDNGELSAPTMDTFEIERYNTDISVFSVESVIDILEYEGYQVQQLETGD